MRKTKFPAYSLLILSAFLIPSVVGLCRVRENVAAEVFAPRAQSTAQPGQISVLDTRSGEIRTEDTEAYLLGVLAAEMPASFEKEALKAQAVAARSYTLCKMKKKTPSHSDADICCDPACCEAWISADETERQQGAENLAKLRAAIEETRGEYMVSDGEVVEAFFFAGSGGRTENAEDVWGSGRPYLKSVPSEGDADEERLHSEAHFTDAEFCSILAASGADSSGGFPSIGDASRSEGGSVREITIGGKSFRGTEIRRMFGLKSANFTLSRTDGGVTFSVRGSGHGVGMSQYGANSMAKNGKKYTEILSHYYTNIQIVKN